MTEDKPSTIVIDVQEAMKRGVAVRIAPDTIIGKPAPLDTETDTREPWERWPRKVQEYTKDIPTVDGKTPNNFKVTEKCGVKIEATGKVCEQKLIATKALNHKFAWDEHHAGGQLQYNFNDPKYFLYCVLHGPFPAGPKTWPSNIPYPQE